MGLISGIFGAYFGMSIDSLYLNGTKPDVNDTPAWKSICRLLIICVLGIPFGALYYGLKSKVSIMILYLFKTTLPFFLATLFMFSYLKLLYIKLRLHK